MVEINKTICTGCGQCIDDCIARNLVLKDGRAEAAGRCILCGHCVAICPSRAVSIPEYDMEDVEETAAGEAAPDRDRLLRAIKFRRSIRSFRPEPVGDEALDSLLQAGRYTATAKNTQGCRFIFVQKELDTFKSMIWDGIGQILHSQDPAPARAYRSFYREHRADPRQDYLFRNAPAVLFIASDNTIDAGLAAQNIELMGISLGLGLLYNGYLLRAADMSAEARAWLGAGDKPLQACALLGYPAVTYKRTAPRRKADVVFH